MIAAGYERHSSFESAAVKHTWLFMHSRWPHRLLASGLLILLLRRALFVFRGSSCL